MLFRDFGRRVKVMRIQTALLPGRNMASKTALNARNLEALGAERLAELLIKISKGRPVVRRLLRLELAGAEGTAELAREVRKRLATIRRSRAVIDSQKRRDLLDELAILRKAIVDRIAGEDAAEALDLMWQFMGLANLVLDRCWDGDETVAGTFKVDDFGAIASAASPDPRKLADRAFEQLTQNAHRQYDNLIRVLTPALGQEGLEHLKQLMIEYSKTPAAEQPEAHRPRIHRRYSGTAFEAERAERLRRQTARSALQDIADAQGDVDAFIDQVDEDARKDPAVATGIARRLLEELDRAWERGELKFHGSIAHLANPAEFRAVFAAARARAWKIYAKRPFRGPEQVYRYLSRYTHKIAIGDSRILSIDHIYPYHMGLF